MLRQLVFRDGSEDRGQRSWMMLACRRILLLRKMLTTTQYTLMLIWDDEWEMTWLRLVKIKGNPWMMPPMSKWEFWDERGVTPTSGNTETKETAPTDITDGINTLTNISEQWFLWGQSITRGCGMSCHMSHNLSYIP